MMALPAQQCPDGRMYGTQSGVAHQYGTVTGYGVFYAVLSNKFRHLTACLLNIRGDEWGLFGGGIRESSVSHGAGRSPCPDAGAALRAVAGW
jgi:hypothetical protein